MIQDAKNKYTDSQAFTDGAAASTDHLNHGADGNLGMGEPMGVVINVEVAALVSDGDETYEFKVQTDTVTGFGSPTDVIERNIGRALLVAGSLHVLPLPPDTSMEQFSRLYVTCGGTTAGLTLSAALLPLSAIPATANYPSGFTMGSGS